MPYCPKCDMEFVEGVTVCTDCGGPLVESKEVADALKQAELEEKEAQMRRRYEELMKASEEEAEAEPGEKRRLAPSKAYVNKEQRYEDMSSSASAFFVVGGLMAVIAVLSLVGVFPLPMTGISRYIIQGLLILMAVGSFAVALSSKKSAASLKTQAADEEKETEEILQWFIKTYSGKDLDDQLKMEDPELSGEELSLKRFELIQDYLITSRDLPDQSYVDALCDMIYARLYDGE